MAWLVVMAQCRLVSMRCIAPPAGCGLRPASRRRITPSPVPPRWPAGGVRFIERTTTPRPHPSQPPERCERRNRQPGQTERHERPLSPRSAERADSPNGNNSIAAALITSRQWKTSRSWGDDARHINANTSAKPGQRLGKGPNRMQPPSKRRPHGFVKPRPHAAGWAVEDSSL